MSRNIETSRTAPVVLCDERGGRHLVQLANGVARVAGAVLDVTAIRRSVGRVLAVGRRRFLVLPARTTDLLEGIERGPQTIGSKDAGPIVLRLGLRSGMRVLEVGAGSGSLTITLATAVAPTGRVLAYERRADVARLLRRNLALAGVDSVVDVREEDVAAGVPERDIDAAAMDVPDPGTVLRHVSEALAVGAAVATFLPTAEQVRSCVTALASANFVDIHTIEVIQRDIEAKETGVRPSFARLGHTGYLTFARKALEPFP